MKKFQRRLKSSSLHILVFVIFTLSIITHTTSSFCQKVVVATDLNSSIAGLTTFNTFAEMNNELFFFADDGTHGVELWKSDGLSSNTTPLVNNLTNDSDISTLINLNDSMVIFTRASTKHLWKSDGTTSGTVLIKNMHNTTNSYTLVNGNVFFIHEFYDDTLGYLKFELWKSDGSTSGTLLIKQLNSISNNNSPPKNLFQVDTNLYFSFDDGITGNELWVSNGTESGTFEIDISDTGSSDPTGFYNFNNELIFQANNNMSGIELWKSNGTSAGTSLISDINPSGSSNPKLFISIGAELYFTANDGIHGVELWKSNGTSAGTALVKDINSGGSSNPKELTILNDNLCFSANDGIHGVELWKSDGSNIGTILVKDINPDGGSNPKNLLNINGTLYFGAKYGSLGIELWKSDGTESGTTLVKDINDYGCSDPQNLIDIGGILFFIASGSADGKEVWVSDGTYSGTFRVRDINSTGGSNPMHFTNVNGKLFFSAVDGEGRELWHSDGSGPGTNKVKNINPNYLHVPYELTTCNDNVFFRFDDGIHGLELWKSNGTPSGTSMVVDLNPTANSYPRNLVCVDDLLFYTGSNGSDFGLWKSDGSASGTVLVKAIDPTGNTSTNEATNVDGTLFFRVVDANGRELWKSDGTTSGTIMVKDIDPVGNGYPRCLSNMNGTLYFYANDGVHGAELWKSDGTEAGTIMIKDLNPTGSSNPHSFTDNNGIVFFIANNDELWKSDGTEAGTILIKESIKSSTTNNIATYNGSVYFTSTDGINGYELWKSDGTPAGTSLVKDINIGNSSDPAYLTAVNGLLLFSARFDGSERALWRSDGTEAGTQMIRDINPFEGWYSLADFIEVNDRLYFRASDAPDSYGIWKSDGSLVGTTKVKDLNIINSSFPDEFTDVNGTLFYKTRLESEFEIMKLEPFGSMYLDSAATLGENNGCKWSNAFTDMSRALALSSFGDSIFVGKGSYAPDTSGFLFNRSSYYQIPDSVVIIGGFNPAIGDTSEMSRNPLIHKTTFSGDLGIIGDTSDNCYNIIQASNTLGSTVDGFYISNGVDIMDHGIINLSNSNLRINRCTFNDNFIKRLVRTDSNTNAIFSNCSFYNNVKLGSEKWLFEINGGQVDIINSTICYNNASVFLAATGSLSFLNSISYGNTIGSISIAPTINNSIIEGGYGGAMDIYPQFQDTLNQDYTLLASSPAIDEGDNSYVENQFPTDLPGNLRISNGIADIGAFEYPLCNHLDFQTLQAIFFQTNGNSWTNKIGWLSDCDPCNWYGIQCDSNNRVISLNLSNNNLSQGFPDSVLHLTHLTDLDISTNSLNGCYNGNLTALCAQLGINSSNVKISAGNNFISDWEDFCQCNSGICPCIDINIWIGGIGNWDVPANWSLGHLPRACEHVIIHTSGV